MIIGYKSFLILSFIILILIISLVLIVFLVPSPIGPSGEKGEKGKVGYQGDSNLVSENFTLIDIESELIDSSTININSTFYRIDDNSFFYLDQNPTQNDPFLLLSNGSIKSGGTAYFLNQSPKELTICTICVSETNQNERNGNNCINQTCPNGFVGSFNMLNSNGAVVPLYTKIKPKTMNSLILNNRAGNRLMSQTSEEYVIS
jgi:competence protein ComGC